MSELELGGSLRGGHGRLVVDVHHRVLDTGRGSRHRGQVDEHAVLALQAEGEEVVLPHGGVVLGVVVHSRRPGRGGIGTGTREYFSIRNRNPVLRVAMSVCWLGSLTESFS